MEDKPKLKKFIEDNSKLLSAIGIFTALTIFSTNLPIIFFAEFFSFTFLFIVILLWMELVEQFPSTEGTWKLLAFENIISFFVLALVFYWLIEYRTLFRSFLVIPLTVLILSLISIFIKKEKLFAWADRPVKRFKALRYLIAIFLLIIVFIVSGFIAAFISEPINDFLDNVKRELNIQNHIREEI